MELSLDGVIKRYPDGTQIGPVSINIRKGEFFSFLGPSGCGKTTILRCIAGFEELTGGSILLQGAPLHQVPAHRRNVGIVFQNYALFPHLSIFENIAFGLRIRRLAETEIKKRVSDALELVGMPELGARFPAEVSGGQQQRVAIARAIVLVPAVILFDEPLSNLDLKLRLQLRSELRKLQQALGITAIFVTHDQSEALTLSDRIAVFSRGQVEQIGAPAEIYERPNNKVVADFIGNANILTGDVRAKDGVLYFESDHGFSLKLPEGTDKERGPVSALIRPEHLMVSPTRSALNGASNIQSLTLDEIVYLGEDLQLRLSSERGANLLVTMKSRDDIRSLNVGTPLFVSVPPERIHVLRE